MKFYKKSIILLFLLILTMGVVCAEDTNQTVQDTLEISDSQDVISDPVEKTFSDLAGDIQKSDDSITLESDYKYNQETDSGTKFIYFKNIKDYTIEGNNHVIDANYQTYVFKVENSGVTIKNLVFKNTNDTAIVSQNSIVTTINVTFINTKSDDNGGAIFCQDSNYYSTNDRFINNNAKDPGSAIYGLNSKIYIDNGTFTSSEPIKWAMIYGSNCVIDIANSVFANTTSKYATAIHNTRETTIKNTKFINLHADATAGAIAIKGGNPTKKTYLKIIDCEFENVSAAKNGGAIFADIYGTGRNAVDGTSIIENTKFNNNAAEFGGAILHLGGHLNIINSTFTNNIAKESGGAVYTSNTTTVINRSTFTGNKAQANPSYGGAVYIDYETATIDSSTFTDNIAAKAGAIYSFYSKYNIINCEFNGNSEDIYTSYDAKGSSIENCGNTTGKTNDRNYTFEIRYNGDTIVLQPNPIKGSASDSYFNLREQGLVTPVKDQGYMGSCWAFGAAGAFESSFLIATGQTIDVSENNIQNLELRYSPYGNINNVESGTFIMTTSYFTSWLGVVNTIDDTYDELGKITAVQYGPDTYRTVNAHYINIKDKKAIKEFLTKYGAMNLFVYGANPDNDAYNKAYNSVYNSKYSGNHYVTLVGWDDNFSKNKFKTTAPGNGAWICKNSWGTDFGDGGYFYISYYDKSLTASAVGFTFENNEQYEKLYQNEVKGTAEFNSKYKVYGQTFTSNGGDILAAVGTYFEKANTPYTVSIYLNGYVAYTQSGVSDHAGYETIKLNKYIAVDDNTTFEIRIKSSSIPLVDNIRMPLMGGNYVVIDGEFVDPANQSNPLVAPIKAYTYHGQGLITKNIVRYYYPNQTIFTVYNVYEADNILASFNGANYTIPIVNNTGSISLGVLPAGEYLVTVTYNNQTYSSQVLVKTSIDIGEQTSVTVGYNTKLTVTAVYFDGAGKPLNNTKLTIILDGKQMNITTNKNGAYSVVIPAGYKIGNHNIEFANPATNEESKLTIKILSRFAGNANVNMYYYDGHTYKVRVRGDDGQFVGKNQIVLIKVGKTLFRVKTNANGWAILKIPYTITPGKYIITTAYKGQTVKNVLNVVRVLKTPKTAIVKKSAKILLLKAVLKKGKIPIAGKVVKFKVNGKIYAAKTNKNGLAIAKINKAAINKLSIRKYIVQTIYLRDIVKSTLIVRR
ncbi:MAG: C1 family peptidase [Methanobrevibacter sp.]|nr:C1 family peptidase [Methanobrevibacter sp.]